ncbi:speckle-type POZ protein-like [Haemaphysalis longicornis]
MASQTSWLTNDASCATHVKVIKLSYTWAIHNFSLRHEETGRRIESSRFSTPVRGKACWLLELYPNGKDEASRGWGFAKFIARDRLLKGADRLLPDDTLTIQCEVLAFVESVNVSQPMGAVAVKVPACRLSQDFGLLLESRQSCDVVLKVEGREIRAHKLVLAARSPVFAAMFEHKMKESKLGRVEITDCDFEVFNEVVEFIYTGRAPKLNDMAEQVLRAADKYDLGRLKAMCEDALSSKLSVETAAELLVLADTHNADQLKANALLFIKAHGASVVETDGWKKMASEDAHLVTEAFCALVAENAALGTGQK